jgi:hypothetical protein
MLLERFIHTYIHRSKSSSPSPSSSYSILLLCACPLLLLLSFCNAPFVCLHRSSDGAVEVGLKQCFGRFFEFFKEPSFRVFGNPQGTAGSGSLNVFRNQRTASSILFLFLKKFRIKEWSSAPVISKTLKDCRLNHEMGL